ncbi:MAG: SGNH/GDSL hydrolase family protein [Bacteroidia bacterium]
MRLILLNLILCVGFQLSVKAQEAYELPSSVKKIVFIGNSITWSGEYINYIETYFRIQKRDLEIINLGLPSETVSGLSEENHAEGRFPRPDLHERLARVLEETKPDLVIASYGMNDGIYLPFDEERFAKFKEGILWLHEEVVKAGIDIIHATPPIYDPKKGEAYANVLDIYSDWLISFRYTSDWDVIDVHWPMKKYLEDQRLAYPSFVLAKDGVHPNATGHWLMAKEILLFLGEGEVAQASSLQEAVESFAKLDELLTLVSKRQKIVRNTYLSITGHKRPGLPEGLPLLDAQAEMEFLDKGIDILLR